MLLQEKTCGLAIYLINYQGIYHEKKHFLQS
jgi:hypothetical protein